MKNSIVVKNIIIKHNPPTEFIAFIRAGGEPKTLDDRSPFTIIGCQTEADLKLSLDKLQLTMPDLPLEVMCVIPGNKEMLRFHQEDNLDHLYESGLLGKIKGGNPGCWWWNSIMHYFEGWMKVLQNGIFRECQHCDSYDLDVFNTGESMTCSNCQMDGYY